jgi:hypothetical protein
LAFGSEPGDSLDAEMIVVMEPDATDAAVESVI